MHTIYILLLHGELLLLLLLHHHHLLDLLLIELLGDHFLLCWVFFLFDLLTTALDLKLTIILLVFVLHGFTILFLLLLLSGEHEKLLLLLFRELLLLIKLLLSLITVFFLLAVALLLTTLKLGIDDFLKLLFRELEGVRVLLVLLLDKSDKLSPLILI